MVETPDLLYLVIPLCEYDHVTHLSTKDMRSEEQIGHTAFDAASLSLSRTPLNFRCSSRPSGGTLYGALGESCSRSGTHVYRDFDSPRTLHLSILFHLSGISEMSLVDQSYPMLSVKITTRTMVNTRHFIPHVEIYAH
jgi:hypothetical protein